MRALLAVLLLLTVAFAGCAGKGGGDDPSGTASPTATGTGTATGPASSSSSKSGTSSTSGTGTGSPAANRAPVAGLAASINGTKVTFNVTGSDQDGDALTWRLAFGDGNSTNGTAVPALANHTFAPGNYSAVLNLTDGKAFALANVSVAITAGAAGAVVFTFTASTTITGSPVSSGLLLGGTPGLGARACAGFLTGESGQDCVFSDVPAAAIGGAYVVTSDLDAPDVEFWDACDPTGETTQAFGGGLDGTVPAGTGCVVMWNYGSASGTFTITVTRAT